MKGHKWRDHKHKMTYPAWVEVKTDEIRCRVVVTPQGEDWPVTFLSFAEKPLYNLERFAPWFRQLARDTGFVEFDTGFHASTFDNTYRWVRSSKGLKADIDQSQPMFILFDLPTHGGTFEQRSCARNAVSAQALGDGFPILVPAGNWAHTPEEVDVLFSEARTAGHEGLMVKSMQHWYERGKRTYGWLKVKPEDDADGRIVEIVRAVSIEGQPLDRAGSVRIAVEDGSEATPHGIPHALGEAMWANPEKYIGQWAEFRYMERDRQGGYRHPVWHRLREAKA